MVFHLSRCAQVRREGSQLHLLHLNRCLAGRECTVQPHFFALLERCRAAKSNPHYIDLELYSVLGSICLGGRQLALSLHCSDNNGRLGMKLGSCFRLDKMQRLGRELQHSHLLHKRSLRGKARAKRRQTLGTHCL